MCHLRSTSGWRHVTKCARARSLTITPPHDHERKPSFLQFIAVAPNSSFRCRANSADKTVKARFWPWLAVKSPSGHRPRESTHGCPECIPPETAFICFVHICEGKVPPTGISICAANACSNILDWGKFGTDDAIPSKIWSSPRHKDAEVITKLPCM